MAAQLIQHGRDHGLPGYMHYRQLCGLGHVKEFSDLNTTMSPDVIFALSSVYGYDFKIFREIKKFNF